MFKYNKFNVKSMYFWLHERENDCAFTVLQIIEKRREQNLPTYLAFVDCTKSFDRVSQVKGQ